MQTLFSIIAILLFTAFPIVLWGYGSLYLSTNVWNRARFIFGMGGGAIAVIVIALFQGILEGNTIKSIAGFSLLLIVLGTIVWAMTASGSPFIRSFLRRVIILHAGIFSLLFALSVVIERYITHTTSLSILMAGIGSYLIAASIEEGVKHISSIGLTAREFRFTRRDFLLFTFFVTLGFVTLESLIYMLKVFDSGTYQVFLTGLSRLIFALPLHVFASSVCVMMWWRALSYRFFSWQYVSLFSLGYILATFIHGVYNTLLSEGLIIPTFCLVGVGYFAFTQWVLEG